MNNDGHRLTTQAALSVLPDWQKSIWKKEIKNLTSLYCLYGDLYAVHKKELAPFVELPDGSIPYF